jgi:hypothetical protein
MWLLYYLTMDHELTDNVFVESDNSDESKREVILTIIKSGWGNKTHNHYYPASALREAADRQTFSGVKMFVDHLSETQRRMLNGLPRSVRDLVGRIKETWYDDESQSLKGRAKLVPWFYEMVASDPELVEASINAAGHAKPKLVDGKQARFVETIDKASSVDWVVVGGAGGKVDALLEARLEERINMLEDMTVEQLVEARPDLIKDILEGPLNEYRQNTDSETEVMEEAVVSSDVDAGEQQEDQAQPVVQLTEAEIKDMVENRAQEIADASIDKYKHEADSQKMIDRLTEAADDLPAKSREAIRKGFEGQHFDSLETLEEALTTAIADRRQEIEEALGGVRVIEGLGSSTPVDMQEARQGSKRGINSVIDDRLGLDSLVESETDSDGE